MPTKHETKVAFVKHEEWMQDGHWLRLVVTIDGYTECQVKRNGTWWPLEYVIE